MKKDINERKKIQRKRLLLAVILISPVTIFAWQHYIFKDASEMFLSIFKVLVSISLFIGIYILYKSNGEYIDMELEVKKSNMQGTGNKKIIRFGKVIEIDKNGKIIKNKKEKDNTPFIYKIPYEYVQSGLIAIWVIILAFIIEKSKTSQLLSFFPSEELFMHMLVALDTIFCLGLWFIYNGYFYNKGKRILFLVLIAVIYVAAYIMAVYY